MINYFGYTWGKLLCCINNEIMLDIGIVADLNMFG